MYDCGRDPSRLDGDLQNTLSLTIESTSLLIKQRGGKKGEDEEEAKKRP